MASATTTQTAPPADKPAAAYPAGVPIKFSPSGTPTPYPGNTTLCHLPPSSPLLPILHNLTTRLATHPALGPKLRLVPPSSWHMTVLDGVRDTECEPGMWPADLPKRGPAALYTSELAGPLREVGRSLAAEGLAPPYGMRVVDFGDTSVGVGVRVRGRDAGEEGRLRRLRDVLADRGLGFRAPNHGRYPFHVTVGYWLRFRDEEEERELKGILDGVLAGGAGGLEFEVGAVEFCTFEDMCAYPRVFYLGEEA